MRAGFANWIRARWLGLLLLAGIAGAFPAAGLSFLAYKERDLVFRIEPGIARWYGGLPAGVRELELPLASADGASLHAWWWPAAARGAPTVLYLHGSRWNLTGQLYRIEQLRDFGFSVLAIDYRGFGKSRGGPPSEASVYEDARVAWERLTRLQPNPAKRYIYGHSLGGAIAIELARRLSEAPESRRRPAAGLIVESSFTSLADVAAAITSLRLPLEWLITQKFESIRKIAEVHIPVLFVHGTADRYIPARFSEELYAAASARKKLLLIEGGSHNSSMRTGSAEYARALHDFFGLRPRHVPKAVR
jgi:alpha-beta hydrolase superfamily lysophospholipase